MIKRTLAVLVAGLALASPAAAQTATASGGWSCTKWASSDPGHPNAPDSYRSFGCSNTGGDWAWVIGTGYSGTLHTSKLQRVCVHDTIFGCITYAVYNRQHGHS